MLLFLSDGHPAILSYNPRFHLLWLYVHSKSLPHQAGSIIFSSLSFNIQILNITKFQVLGNLMSCS